MKRKVFPLLGFCYVVFALMASVGTFSPVNSASLVPGPQDSVAQENRGSDGHCQRLSGLTGSTEVPEGTPAQRMRHGWLPVQAKLAQQISGETVAAIVQEDRTKNFLPNCMILWTAEWCSSCKNMYPVVESLREDGYTVYVLDYDENRALGRKMGVKSLPTSIIWEDKEEVKRHVGVVSEEKILETLKKNEEPEYEIW